MSAKSYRLMITALAVVVITALALPALPAAAAPLDGRGPGGRSSSPGSGTIRTQPPLSSAEIQALNRALNDEYHAIAVYQAVIDTFGPVAPFTNILKAEQKHAAAVIRLMQKYGVTVPPNPWLGNAPTFSSVAEACAAGVEAELLNRDLYDQLKAVTTRADLLQVFNALEAASEYNHLPAFQSCAAN